MTATKASGKISVQHGFDLCGSLTLTHTQSLPPWGPPLLFIPHSHTSPPIYGLVFGQNNTYTQ